MSSDEQRLQIAVAIVNASQPEGSVQLSRESVCPVCKKPGNGPYLKLNKRLNGKTYRYPAMFHKREQKPRWCSFTRVFMADAVKQLPKSAVVLTPAGRSRSSVGGRRRSRAETPAGEAAASEAGSPQPGPQAVLAKFGGFATDSELLKEGYTKQGLETALKSGSLVGAPEPEGKFQIYALPGSVRADLQGKLLSYALHARFRKREAR